LHVVDAACLRAQADVATHGLASFSLHARASSRARAMVHRCPSVPVVRIRQSRTSRPDVE
jgi:hypothetical protein